jgi:hypothetical protein
VELEVGAPAGLALEHFEPLTVPFAFPLLRGHRLVTVGDRAVAALIAEGVVGDRGDLARAPTRGYGAAGRLHGRSERHDRGTTSRATAQEAVGRAPTAAGSPMTRRRISAR